MAARILLVRHGRSEANDAGLWQGQGDSPLSATGADQAAAIAERLSHLTSSRVISSDLRRAVATADAIAGRRSVDPSWKEMDLGAWEGATFEEVLEKFPDLLTAIRNGEPLPFGETGETLPAFETRINATFDALADTLAEEDDQAVVVTHGGAIDAVVGRFLGKVPRRRAYPIVTNTSITEFKLTDSGWRLSRLNDALHLDESAGFLGRAPEEGYEVVGLIRHGITEANMSDRIQGQMCWGLHADGHVQAKRLAANYPAPDRVLSSPQQRALETAEAFGLPVVSDDRLMEMSFGKWEGKIGALLRGDPLVDLIWTEGQDLPRGHTGETFVDVRRRIAAFLEDLDVDPKRRTVVVSHGGTIRAGIAAILDRGNDIHDGLEPVGNATVTHLALDGPNVRFPGKMIIDIGVKTEV